MSRNKRQASFFPKASEQMSERISVQRLPQSVQPTQQQGMALLIVLFMVLLIGAASVIALRDSQTSQDLTTASQVKQLLFHASDVPLAYIDKVLQDPNLLAQWHSEEGPIGYLLRPGEQFITAEYVICYQPTQQKTLYAGAYQHKIISQIGGVQNRNGYCHIDAGTGNYFTSERRVVATQISFVRADSVMSEIIDAKQGAQAMSDPKIQTDRQGLKTKRHTNTPFAADTVTVGEAAGMVEDSQPVRIRAYIVSVIPILSQASLSEVDACLAMPMVGNGRAGNNRADRDGVGKNSTSSQDTADIKNLSLIACLQRTHTPYNLQVQDYHYSLQIQSIQPTNKSINQ